MEFMQILKCPLLEPRGNLDRAKLVCNLALKFPNFNASLLAVGFRPLCAVIVSVVKKERFDHVSDGRLATGTRVAIATCEFEPALRTYYLMFLLRSDHTGASAAVDQA